MGWGRDIRLCYDNQLEFMEESPSSSHLSLSNMVILGRLGRGGTSHVFKAQSTRNKQLYAMKVIDKKAKNYNHAALQRELKIHRALFNPYVIRLEGHFEDCENHYVLTEYCEGGEMTRLIAEDLSEEKLANVVHQIVIALTYLHSQNIAHCDLKLSNLLLHKGRIKLCDFGFSQHLQETPASEKSLCGTIYYMAPEILRDKKRTFHKEGDVWALGISLLVLITKKQPYSGDSFSILRRQVIAGEREKLPQLSPELTDLMDRFLEMDPSRRIRLEEVMAHPFLKKYSSQLNLQITVPRMPVKQQKKVNEKMEEAVKLNSENQSEEKEKPENSRDRAYLQQEVSNQREQHNPKDWTFKRTSSESPDNDCTVEKKINKGQVTDNDKTIRNLKTKIDREEGKVQAQLSSQLAAVDAKLIRPLEEFHYQTKNDGFIKILRNGALSIKVKNISFEISSDGQVLKLFSREFALKELNAKGCSGTYKQPYELYSYAKEVIDILKCKKYAITWTEKHKDAQLLLGISLDWKKIRCLRNSNGSTILLEWIEGEQHLCIKQEGQKSKRTSIKDLQQDITHVFVLMRDYLLEQKPSLDALVS